MTRKPATARSRAAALRELRDRKVAESALAYVRANAPLFYESVGKVPHGPAIWISGDCHSENIGAVASRDPHDSHGEGAVLELNDFDETVIGEPAYDVLRLALALASAGRTAGLSGTEELAMVGAMAEGYLRALSARGIRGGGRGGGGRGVNGRGGGGHPARLRRLLDHAASENRRALLDHRAPRDRTSGERRFILGDRYWPLTMRERAAIAAIACTDGVRALVASLPRSRATAIDAPEARVHVVDAAFRVAGTGSLGVFRAAALVRIGGKHHHGAHHAHHAHRARHARDGGDDDDALHLLDLKEAIAAHPPRDAHTPRNDAERIITGAQALAPRVGGGMVSARFGSRSLVVRELMPQELKVSLADLRRDEAGDVARSLGAVVGRAHGRQLDARQVRAWRKAFGSFRWIADALPKLIAVHEEGYLQTCISWSLPSLGGRRRGRR